MKSVIGFLVIVLVLAGAFFYYKNYYRPQKDFAEGEVTCTGCLTPSQKAEFLKENSGEDADGQKEHKTTRGNIEAGATAATGVAGATGVSGATGTTGMKVYPPAQMASYPAQPGVQPVSTAANGYGAPPAGDTVAPNPPNGMVFEGKGVYQWYRQGNLTWRVNTMTGVSCIAFATDEEWRKERVLAHGCGRSA